MGIAKDSLMGNILLHLKKERKIMHVIGKSFFFNEHLDYFLDLIILLASVMQPTFQIIIPK